MTGLYYSLLASMLIGCSSIADQRTNNLMNTYAATGKQHEVKNLSYGSHPLQKMDVLFPADYDQNTPVVFLIHGGAFVAGTKEDFSGPANLFRREGFIIVNLSYRLADTGGMFGASATHRKSSITISSQVEDIHSAVTAFISVAAQYGAGTGNLFVAGHSAGGTLALLYSLGPYGLSSGIRGCANWAGVTDLSLPDARIVALLPAYVKELMFRISGSEPTMQHNAAYRKLSPVWVLQQRPGLPVISIYPEYNYVFHYPGETELGLAATRRMHDLLRQKGIREKLSVYRGSNHSFSGTGAREQLIEETATFFRSILAGD